MIEEDKYEDGHSEFVFDVSIWDNAVYSSWENQTGPGNSDSSSLPAVGTGSGATAVARHRSFDNEEAHHESTSATLAVARFRTFDGQKTLHESTSARAARGDRKGSQVARTPKTVKHDQSADRIWEAISPSRGNVICLIVTFVIVNIALSHHIYGGQSPKKHRCSAPQQFRLGLTADPREYTLSFYSSCKEGAACEVAPAILKWTHGGATLVDGHSQPSPLAGEMVVTASCWKHSGVYRASYSGLIKNVGDYTRYQVVIAGVAPSEWMEIRGSRDPLQTSFIYLADFGLRPTSWDPHMATRSKAARAIADEMQQGDEVRKWLALTVTLTVTLTLTEVRKWLGARGCAHEAFHSSMQADFVMHNGGESRPREKDC